MKKISNNVGIIGKFIRELENSDMYPEKRTKKTVNILSLHGAFHLEVIQIVILDKFGEMINLIFILK